MVVRSLSTTLWKSADPRLRVFVAFSSATQATTAIQTGQVRMQDRMLTISRLTPTDASVLIRQQSAQTLPIRRQLPLPTPFSEPVLTTPGHDGLNIPVHPPRLRPQASLFSANPTPGPVPRLPTQASTKSLAILDPSDPAAERLQQELDDIKQRYEQIQEAKDVLDLKNTGLLAQYGQATADRSRVDHELLSVRSEIRSLNEEMENLQKRLQDAYRQYQKERDKQWHMRCISSREEWEQECLSLRTELKEVTSQQDETMRCLQKCQNELAAAREAHGKELVKRAEREREIQVLRSREAVEPELLKAFLAIEALTDKGTVKLEPPQPHTPRKKKKEE